MNMHKTNYCSVLYDVPLIYLLFSDLEPKLHIKIVGLIKEQSFHIARSIIEVSSRVQKFWFNGVHCPSVGINCLHIPCNWLATSPGFTSCLMVKVSWDRLDNIQNDLDG